MIYHVLCTLILISTFNPVASLTSQYNNNYITKATNNHVRPFNKGWTLVFYFYIDREVQDATGVDVDMRIGIHSGMVLTSK
jgi:hypothetical protein